MPEHKRIGIIGAGLWADRAHIPSFLRHPDAEVIAIASRTRERAEALAGKYHIPYVYDDYRELLRHDGLEGVVVIAPNDVHRPIVLDAIRAGLAILCEKPLANTVEDAREMVDAARARGVVNMVAFSYRFDPHCRRIKELIDQGWLGDLYHINVNWMVHLDEQYFGRTRPDYAWRYDKSVAGSGVLGDIGSHVLDLMRWYGGEFARLCGRLTTLISERTDPDTGATVGVDTDDVAAVTVEYENGAIGVLHLSRIAPGDPMLKIELFGSRARLVYASDLRGAPIEEFTLQPVEMPARLIEGYPGPERGPVTRFRFKGVARHFLDCIGAGEITEPTFDDGLAAQRAIAAVLRSNDVRGWVPVIPPPQA
jgi:predicted dehydrogenase